MKEQVGDLFQFVWAVDQDGYDIHDVPPRDGRTFLESHEGYREVRRRGGLWRFYRPLEDDSAVTRNFSDLTPNDANVLKFVNRFSLPRNGDTERLDVLFEAINHYKKFPAYP